MTGHCEGYASSPLTSLRVRVAAQGSAPLVTGAGGKSPTHTRVLGHVGQREGAGELIGPQAERRSAQAVVLPAVG